MSFLERRIPRSLKECYEEDRIAQMLWIWSAWLKKWGTVVLCVLIVVGIISTIGDTLQMADIDEDLIFVTLLNSSISWGLYAVIEFCTYNVLSVIVSALATIVQNTKITSNVELYIEAKAEGVVKEATAAPVNNGGKAPLKKESPAFSKPAETPGREGFITCPSCMQMQKAGRSTCFRCGQQFESSYKCGKCGQEGPYEGNCPSCGSTQKIFN